MNALLEAYTAFMLSATTWLMVVAFSTGGRSMITNGNHRLLLKTIGKDWSHVHFIMHSSQIKPNSKQFPNPNCLWTLGWHGFYLKTENFSKISKFCIIKFTTIVTIYRLWCSINVDPALKKFSHNDLWSVSMSNGCSIQACKLIN